MEGLGLQVAAEAEETMEVEETATAAPGTISSSFGNIKFVSVLHSHTFYLQLSPPNTAPPSTLLPAPPLTASPNTAADFQVQNMFFLVIYFPIPPFFASPESGGIGGGVSIVLPFFERLLFI